MSQLHQLTSQAIVLRRTDYGEADRILSLLTPEYGKLSLMAKGVRRVRSKLAGGIELFSVSDIVFIKGRNGQNGLGTLISSRLEHHYEAIVSDINRTMLGYDLIKQLNMVTEDETEPDYFELLANTFAALDDPVIDINLIRCWFMMQLLRIGGHGPNLMNDTAGQKLAADRQYAFDYDSMGFQARDSAPFGVDDIKFLRLGFAGCQPAVLQKITGLDGLLERCWPLTRTVGQNHLSI